jgi:hypothetical protein
MTATIAPAAPGGASTRSRARLLETLRTGLDAVDARLRAAADALPAARWAERRADGGWSLGEVLEHMCLANEAYLPYLRAMVERGGAAGAGDDAWRPTLFAGLLAWALAAPRRLSAPRTIRPGPSPRPGVLEALLATHDEIRALMTRAERLDWRRMRFTSPFAWWVRPNFGDACLILLRHGERHAGQMERLVAELRAR